MRALTLREQRTAALYADLHRHASPRYAEDRLLPAFRTHLRALGLDPGEALRGRTFLDAGCGGFAGGASIALALDATRVTGVDFSADNIAAARTRFAGASHVEFLQQHLLELTLPSDAFDFVYCVGVLHHTEDPEAAFRALVRVTKPGGRLYVGVYGRGGVYNSAFVPAARLAGRMIPRGLTAVALRAAPALLRPSSSLMDLMYVPIQRHYSRDEIEAWFRRSGLSPSFLRHAEQPDTRASRLLVGDGTMIFFSAVKP